MWDFSSHVSLSRKGLDGSPIATEWKWWGWEGQHLGKVYDKVSKGAFLNWQNHPEWRNTNKQWGKTNGLNKNYPYPVFKENQMQMGRGPHNFSSFFDVKKTSFWGTQLWPTPKSCFLQGTPSPRPRMMVFQWANHLVNSGSLQLRISSPLPQCRIGQCWKSPSPVWKWIVPPNLLPSDKLT